jgi:transposase
MSTITIGVDLAKSVFSVCEVDGGWPCAAAAGSAARGVCAVAGPAASRHGGGDGGVQRRASLGTALSGVWAAAADHGGPVRHAVPQEPRSKNDRNDAEAIATAARQGNMRFVPVKDVDQQARLSWHRVREGYKAESLAIGNRLRGLLAEFGVVVAQSDLALRRLLADLDAQLALPAEFKELLRDLSDHWTSVAPAHRRVRCTHRGPRAQDERCVRLRAIIGIGPITADAAVATVGNAREFKHGRQMAAWLGLVPTSIPAADTRGWARSAVAAMRTCARC